MARRQAEVKSETTVCVLNHDRPLEKSSWKQFIASKDSQLKLMSRKLADIIQQDASLVRRARDYINRLLNEDQGAAIGDIMEWRNILDAYPIQRLVRFVTSSSERARRLRQSNPFFAILNTEERAEVEDKLRVRD